MLSEISLMDFSTKYTFLFRVFPEFYRFKGISKYDLYLIITHYLQMELYFKNIGEYKSDLWNKVMKRILKLQSSCGDLCNTGKEVKPGEFIGTVKSDVNITNSNYVEQQF